MKSNKRKGVLSIRIEEKDRKATESVVKNYLKSKGYKFYDKAKNKRKVKA